MEIWQKLLAILLPFCCRWIRLGRCVDCQLLPVTALAVGLFVVHTHIPISFIFNSSFFVHSCCFCSFPYFFFFACCWSSEQWVARKYKLYNYMTLWRQRRLHFKHEACAYLLPLIYFYNSFFVPNRCWVRFRCCKNVFFPQLFCLRRVIVPPTTHLWNGFSFSSIPLGYFPMCAFYFIFFRSALA